MSWLMRLFSATRYQMPCSSYTRPTTSRLTCSSTSTMTPSGRPRLSTPIWRAVARSPCSVLCISFGDRNKSAVPSSGTRNPKPSGCPCTVPVIEIEFGDDAELAFAIGHQLTVSLHCGEPCRERFALRVAADAQRAGDVLGERGHAQFPQVIEDLFARGNVDFAYAPTGPAGYRRARRPGLFSTRGFFDNV